MTEKGQAALERAAPIHMAKVDEYFQQHLSEEEVDVLARAMGKVLRGLGADVDWLLADLEAAAPQ